MQLVPDSVQLRQDGINLFPRAKNVEVSSVQTSCRFRNIDGCRGVMTFQRLSLGKLSYSNRWIYTPNEKCEERVPGFQSDTKTTPLATCDGCGYHGSLDQEVLTELHVFAKSELETAVPVREVVTT